MEYELRSALSRTYGFTGWSFENEAEFKHELFHQLAKHTHQGLRLIEQVPDTPSCRLHSEGKVENGNPAKADILICDPARKQRFNYHVEHILELKVSLTAASLRDEAKKMAAYRNRYAGTYLISDRNVSSQVKTLASELNPSLIVLDRSEIGELSPVEIGSTKGIGFESSVQLVKEAIHETIWIYGNERRQYHSFFWCNYEHEENRRHSFPCEGDFNAHLYHRLRNRLPPGVQIRSEVHPLGQRERIDLVVSSKEERWCIPIDIKINWDQFKPSYKNGEPKKPEAQRIIDRLAGLCAEFERWYPLIVVIQGEWRIQNSRSRDSALAIFDTGKFGFELISFNEAKHKIEHSSYR